MSIDADLGMSSYCFLVSALIKALPHLQISKASTAWVSSRAFAVLTTTACRATASCAPTTSKNCCGGIPQNGGSAPVHQGMGIG